MSVTGQRFTVGLDGAPAQIEMDEAQPDARLEVSSPLRFSATAPKSHLPLRVAVSTDLYGGRIRLAQGAAPAWREVQGDSIRISLEQMLGVAVKQPLVVPCNRLDLSQGDPSEAPAPDLSRGTLIGVGWDAVPFCLAPEGTEPLDVYYRGAFSILETRPGWLHVAATWSDGSKLEGWTPERHVSIGFGDCRGCSCGATEGGIYVGRVHRPQLVQVTLRAGAAIAAAAGGSVWATVARDIEVEAVAPGGSDEWLQIAALPGLPWAPGAFQHEHLWVRARDVSLRTEPRPPPS